MNWKKTPFSYGIWFLYTLAAGSGLFCIVALIGSGAGQPLYQAALWCAGVLFIAGFCAFLVYRLSEKFLKGNDIRYPVWAERIAALLLLAAGCWLRSGGAVPDADRYGSFAKVMVVANAPVPQALHGAENVYLLFLRGMCVVFGNRQEVCLAAQTVLQLLAGALLYLGVRRLSGGLPALVMLAFLELSGEMIREVRVLSPRPLYLFLYAIGLLLAAKSVQRKRGFPIWGVLAGLFMGFLLYLDLAGATLVVITCSVFYKRLPDGEDGGLKGGLAVFGASLGGLAAGFFLSALVCALSAGESFLGVLSGWCGLYRPEGLAVPVQIQDLAVRRETLILFCLLAFGIFSFFGRRKWEGISVWGLMSVLLAAGIGFGCFTQQLPGIDLFYILLAVSAGVGLLHGVYDAADREAAALQLQKEFALPREEPARSDSQIQYIENPLPLPKKHERRTMDYDYEVADDDDFDYP